VTFLERRSPVESIKTSINRFITKRNFYIKIKGYEALIKWDEIVGEKLAKYTKPLSYKEGVLTIGVVSALFMRELTAMKSEILKRVQEKVGESPVHDLRFRIIERGYRPKVKHTKDDDRIDISDVKLTPEDIAWIDNLVERFKGTEKAKMEYRRMLYYFKKNERAREKMGYKHCKRCGVLFKGKGDLCPACILEEHLHARTNGKNGDKSSK
jgi:rubrerythrin